VTPVAPADLAARIAARRRPGETLVAGITGSVAVGKTTLARQLAEALAQDLAVEIVSTDGFLKPNAVLEPAGLLMRKGFPESYDHPGMADAISGLKRLAAGGQPVPVPAYSHALYDIDPAGGRAIALADAVLVEGLGLAPAEDGGRPPLDLLIYIDADEADVRRWYVDRFIGLWAAAATDPTSFYARFRHMDEAEMRAFAAQVWEGVNLPNWQQHIARARPVADIVVKKAGDHSLWLA
jgi:type I pantothenate kinase